jgi:hypothetical protein
MVATRFVDVLLLLLLLLPPPTLLPYCGRQRTAADFRADSAVNVFRGNKIELEISRCASISLDSGLRSQRIQLHSVTLPQIYGQISRYVRETAAE